MMDPVERAVPVPQAQVVMHGAARRQVFGQIAPLATGAQDVHHPVDHLAQVDPPLAATRLAGRKERLDQRPFLVGQIARIAQPVAVVAGAVLGRPHGAPQTNQRIGAAQRITTDSALQAIFRLTDSHDSQTPRTDTKPACVLRSERNPKPIEEMYLPVRGHGRLVAPAVTLRWPLFQEQ